MELFNLVGKLAIEGVDEANRDIDGVTSKASGFKSAMGAIGKGALLVTGAVATGTVALVKKVSGAYGELQQSIGGIETLFGESADKVIDNANNAFKTAGISANDYMQQVTSFSASLLQSLGGDTEKAAESAHMAVIDMADNANKMGTSMEMIQNAYQGFSKQNYTMLDNLKLGYGGTKSEMERLLADAEKISGIKYDISNLNDVYQAIHVIQSELGITGTTALEASETITGSFGSLSASWQNFLAGLGNPKADMEQLVSDVANSLAGAINNVTPIIENITSVLPTVLEAIINSVMSLLPSLVDTFTTLVLKIVGALINNLPLFLQGLLQLVLGIAKGLINFLPILIAQLPLIIGEIVNFLISSIPEIVSVVAMAFVAIVQALPQMVGSVIEAFKIAFSSIVPTASIIMGKLFTGISEWFKSIVVNVREAGRNVVEGFVEFVSTLPERVFNLVLNVIKVIIDWRNNMIDKAKSTAVEFSKSLINGLKDLPNRIQEVGSNLVTGLWSGIKSKLGWLKDKIGNFCNNIIDSFMGAFDAHSPARKMMPLGGFIVDGMAVGIEDDDSAENAIDAKAKSIIDIANNTMRGFNFSNGVDDLVMSSPMQKYQLDFNAQIGSLNDGFERLINLVGQYLPNIANGMERNIVLDGNSLVVGMSKRMDNQLGKMAVAKGRGNV